jgi:hypothetical protein
VKTLFSHAVIARVSADDESWANDGFFRQSAKQPVDDPQDAPDSSTGIFGSSNGSKSQSRSRGERGGNETEGNVTGSATVRIIRPTSEAGGAQAKLERTPTLTNEGVIRLVEAGFSEGTIIKRIEDSPSISIYRPTKLQNFIDVEFQIQSSQRCLRP